MSNWPLARKGAAIAILGTFAGLMVESQRPDGELWRAPVSGAIVLGIVGLVSWAEMELKGDGDGV